MRYILIKLSEIAERLLSSSLCHFGSPRFPWGREDNVGLEPFSLSGEESTLTADLF